MRRIGFRAVPENWFETPEESFPGTVRLCKYSARNQVLSGIDIMSLQNHLSSEPLSPKNPCSPDIGIGRCPDQAQLGCSDSSNPNTTLGAAERSLRQPRVESAGGDSRIGPSDAE